jgi:hypothetical protein
MVGVCAARVNLPWWVSCWSMSSQQGRRAHRVDPGGSAPFESPFAPSAVSPFTTNFVLVTVDKCYVKIAHITLTNRT